MFIKIGNRGQEIRSTNYWDSEMAKSGLVYLTWNAGAARLLVPDTLEVYIKEIKTADYVIVSRGPCIANGNKDSLELLFEDMSDSPFSIQISTEQTDRLLSEGKQGVSFPFLVWSSLGLVKILEGKYRVVDEIPCLKEWD